MAAAAAIVVAFTAVAVQWIGGGKGGALLRARKKQIVDRIHKFRRDEEAFLVALKSESVFGQQLSSWS